MLSAIRPRALPGPFTSRMRYFTANSVVIVNEEFFQLADELPAQVVYVPHVSKAVIVFLYRHHSIVTSAFLFVMLLALSMIPIKRAFQQAPGQRRLVH